MKILITGATGFIGRHLTARLAGTHDLHAVVRKGSSAAGLENQAAVFFYDGNIAHLLAYFEKEKFDGVVHLASLFLAAHTPEKIADLIDANIRFGTELLEACRAGNVKWFINTGTFWQHYHNETYNPVNLYAATKEAFTDIAKYYTETSALVFATVKLSDTFGPGDTRNKIFNLWADIARTGEPLEMSAGEQIIDISYIDDVVDAFELLIGRLGSAEAHRCRNSVFGVSSAERMPLKMLAALFEEATGAKLNIRWGARPYREREVMTPWEDAEAVPGWRPKHTLKEAITKTIGAIR